MAYIQKIDNTNYKIGVIQNTVIDGKGTIVSNSIDGLTIMEGNFIFNILHGYGVKDTEKETMEGIFHFGNLIEGTIKYKIDNSKYEGKFHKGIFHGEGILYCPETNTTQEGLFSHGRLISGSILKDNEVKFISNRTSLIYLLFILLITKIFIITSFMNEGNSKNLYTLFSFCELIAWMINCSYLYQGSLLVIPMLIYDLFIFYPILKYL